MKSFAALLLVAAGEHDNIPCRLHEKYRRKGRKGRATTAVVVPNHTDLLKLVARVAAGLGDCADAADAFITAIDFEFDNVDGNLVAY